MDPPAEGCPLCGSTWGDWWEAIDGVPTFFCCQICAIQWRTILGEVRHRAGWTGPMAVELKGNRWGRTGVATRGGDAVRFSVVFTPDGRLRRFDLLEPLPTSAAPPAPAAPPEAPPPAAPPPPPVPPGPETMHPKLVERLEFEAETYPDLTTVPVEEGREFVREMASELGRIAGPVPSVSQITNSSYRCGDHRVPVRIYTPVDGDPPFPVVVLLHGGGFVFGDLDTHDGLSRELANRSRAVVVTVGFRRAPEFPYPNAVEDAFAAFAWVALPTTAARLQLDPDRLAVVGDDTGAALALAAAMLARERGGPAPRAAALVCPVLARAPDVPSYREFAVGAGLEAAFLEWAWAQYLPTADDAADPHAVPWAATDLAGLPPTLLLTAGCDPARDEGEKFGERLRAAGVETTVRRYSGMLHAFLDYRGVVEDGWHAMEELGEWLRAALEPARTAPPAAAAPPSAATG